jgi:hypothetical protein
MLFSKTEERQIQDSVVNLSHPPILQAVKIKKTEGLLRKGTILGFNEITKEYEPYVAHENIVVLTKDINTDIDDMAQVIRHGVLNSASIEVDKSKIALLAKNAIYIF